MSKIEVLTVPDEQLWGGSARDQGEGAIAILRDGIFRKAIKADEKPALLAALLEDAGAVKIEYERRERPDGSWYLEQINDGAVSEGEYALIRLPIRKGAK